MELETAGTIYAKNATKEDIEKTFADDLGRGEFVILSQGKQVFIQAAGEDDGLYTVEYREGDDDHHFRCDRGLPKVDVEKLFLKYLTGDNAWRSDFPWRDAEFKPWWKFW